ncbi:major capsid protein [Fuchsiella alkaliacetigena]|uniref:major capsid protein n=1 Tax=Fuchsiella alkaliacetigena TaxID=957042 RepID=UPI00200B086F|nr:family 1 encapsulin nanocompartment shell protein [Fuchsiella alkaliacetigena]MCK8824726.1 bacteriocin family protein [Fuchsiella alkaliacetigena]
MSKNIIAPDQLSGASYNFNRMVLAGLTLNEIKKQRLKTNASLLRKDEWKVIDDTIVTVARNRLHAVQDLIDRNLTKDAGGLGSLLAQYEKASGMTEAEISMSPITDSEEDTQTFDIASTPIPIVQKDFTLDIRRLQASRRRGTSLDDSQATEATRKVSEASEDMVVNGVQLTLNGNKIYGYTSFPDRIQGAAPGSWDTLSNIYTTVRLMIKDARDNGDFRGPFLLYTASEQWDEMMEVYEDGSGQTARDRVLDKFPNLEDIKPLYNLEDGELVLVQMTSDVVNLQIAESINTIEWNTHGELKSHYKVMACWVPEIRSDSKGRCGLVHYTGA